MAGCVGRILGASRSTAVFWSDEDKDVSWEPKCAPGGTLRGVRPFPTSFLLSHYTPPSQRLRILSLSPILRSIIRTDFTTHPAVFLSPDTEKRSLGITLLFLGAPVPDRHLLIASADTTVRSAANIGNDEHNAWE